MPITHKSTDCGFWWCYEHSQGEPDATLLAAIKVAATVAVNEAAKSGQTYLVGSTSQPPAVYVIPCDHPDAAKSGISIMYELAPSGDCTRRSGGNPIERILGRKLHVDILDNVTRH